VIIENKIYCFWLNEEDMSYNRKVSLENLINISECEVVLIDKYILPNYILPKYPLHEGYEYLSEIQKSDYLRCYFMQHYGGGYSDIKKTTGSWLNYFDKLNSNNNIYAIGYKEFSPIGVAALESNTINPSDCKFGLDFNTNEDFTKWDSIHIKEDWDKLIGNGAFIFKKNTEFTREWWNILNERMDIFLPKLKINPKKWDRDSFGHVNPHTGEESRYPIPWTGIQGIIFHPLCLKYKNNIMNDLPSPICVNYK
jgi:hypothetical protein